MFEHGGRKYSQAALARALHVRPTTVSDWVTGKRPPHREHIAMLAVHFGSTSRYIYQLLGEEPPADLNDTYERVLSIIYRLSPQQQQKLLDDLKGKYGHKT